MCITYPVSRALHTDRVEVSLTGRVGAPAAPNGSCLLFKKLLLYRIANNSISFSAVHHAQHAHMVKPRIRPTVGTRLAASPGLPPYPIAGHWYGSKLYFFPQAPNSCPHTPSSASPVEHPALVTKEVTSVTTMGRHLLNHPPPPRPIAHKLARHSKERHSANRSATTLV